MPVITSLRNPSLRARHWETIEKIIGKVIIRDKSFTLGNLMEMNIFKHKDRIQDISTTASNEATLEIMLQKIVDLWQSTDFRLVAHVGRDTLIIAGADDIMAQLEESQVTVGTIRGSRYVGPIKVQVEEWERKLQVFSRTLDEWLNCQRNWLYLEQIFSTPDIQRQLPNEFKLFSGVDKAWKDVMRRVEDRPNALKAAIAPGTLETLSSCNANLEKIHRCLEDYLETKRLVFPRFYFLSNDELLDILAQSKDPQAVQPHLGKCFGNIKQLDIRHYGLYCRNIRARGPVEQWLGTVESGMFETVKKYLKLGLSDWLGCDIQDWVVKHPGQVVLTVTQIMFNKEVSKCFEQANPRQELIKVKDNMVESLNKFAGLVSSNILSYQRMSIEALLTITVHNRDIVNEMISFNVKKKEDFEWKRQLRYEWDEQTNNCLVLQSNASFQYGYEYLGCSPRLVITPLTDRCYLTLTGALHLHLGGSPAGPAGTGKTETVKDLAKAMGKQCVVFNCSEGLDYKMLGKFFSGLAQSGSWCCFDEFNRIDVEVLSVVAQQIHTIKAAKDTQSLRFMFESRDIKLNMSCGYFITMNPTYAGRVDLPDNLKSLFRPVAMMVPDYALIAEIILFSEGFRDAKSLSQKIVNLYQLASKQLSQQDHYDFGMRAIKSVLVMAGHGRLKPLKDEEESHIMIHSLRDANLPKFLAEDVPLFESILADLFPGIVPPSPDQGVLERAISMAIRDQNLQHWPSQMERVKQLHSQILVRHGVMLVGPTGGGKTTVRNILQRALVLLPTITPQDDHKGHVETFTLNPKCVKLGELYGETNPVTFEWTDGLIASATRKFYKDLNIITNWRWIVLDGPVDTLWVENLNTVLDDSKVLCLASGERISLAPGMRLIFEVDNLSQASPATISRCAMVYMDPVDLGWQPFVKSWLYTALPKELPDSGKSHLLKLFEHSIDKGLKFLKKYQKFQTIMVPEMSIVSTLCHLLSAYFDYMSKHGGFGNPGMKSPTQLLNFLGKLFAFCYTWSFGGILHEINICNEFDNFMREVFEVEPPVGVRLPAGNRSMYSFFLNMESGSFTPWDVLVPTTKSLIEKGAMLTIGETMGLMTEIVPTVDIIRFSFLTSLLLLQKHPVLITGDSGVGKSALINNMLKRLQKEVKPKIQSGLLSTTIQFSAQTSSARLQGHIMHKLIKKGKDALGAPKGRKVVVFVDDLNMPAPEQYGAQPPLELLRQFLELGGFYDTAKLQWKDILDVTMVTACGPPGGGRNPTSPRLLKHFCIFALPTPSTRSLQHIYQVQLGRFIIQDGDFMPEVQECLFSMVSASIAIYYRMGSTMLPTPTKSHYTFNIRDLSKVIQGLLQAHNSVIVSKDNCAQLLAHEATRVFHDRLVDNTDRMAFFDILSDNLHDYFKVGLSLKKLRNEQVLFGDFFEIDETANRIYQPLADRSKLGNVLEDYYMRLNFGNSKSSQLVFFKDAVEHIVRAARVFRQPGGHLLLVGLDGTGKSTVVHLASHIARCELFRLSLQKHYGTIEFRDDLKRVFKISGVKGQNTVFLLADSDIVKESFLEDINCILNSGEVPDLFDNEELDGITMDLKSAAAEADIPDTRVAVYQFFIQRVRQNLHVVLTMSPAGDKFRQRCRMNPALINCCTIDWYDEWTDEAMLSVAQVFFQNTEFLADPRYDIEVACVDIHRSISVVSRQYWEEMRRHYYSTPSSYMELIRLYSIMLRDNKQEFVNNRERLQIGLSKLSEANSLVGEMQEELVTLGPKIEEKARDTEILLEQLEKDKIAVEEVQQIVEAEKNIMDRETQIVQDYADECELDLASVLPALQNAIGSLETLDKASISEIRVYTHPPVLVKTVMDAVCVLFQKRPDWVTAKQMLGDANFLKMLLQFDKNGLPDKVFKRLKRYSKDPDFNPEKVGSVSEACRSICEWVLAIEHYNDVYKMVKPKQKRVEDAREALKLAQNNLVQKMASLKKIQDHLKMIERQYQDSVNQREGLKERKKTTGLRLQRASLLIKALDGEKVRWADSVKTLDFKLEGLVGDTLVGAAAVSYLGAFTATYRKQLVKTWVEMCQTVDIPISKSFDLARSMVDDNQVMKWHNEGLPRDNHSKENAMFVKRARKWPLLIDPQGQALNWVKEMEGSRLKIVTATDHNLMRTMETAIRVGDPVLIKDVGEELDPALRPVLLQETYSRAGHLVILIGDTEIEYNERFRLYLTTTMTNPHYLPAIFIQANIINFTVTFDGLQEQLLSAVVKQERPKLESDRRDLMESITNDRQALRDLEDKSLSLLQKSEGHILDDQDLVETLQKSKGIAGEIYSRVEQSEETEKKINIARKRYLPVATRGAVLYFVLAELATIDVMYQFSLSWFQDINTRSSLDSGEISDNLRQHLKNMIETLTNSIYRVVSVGLFAHHQLTFSFMICTSIMQSNSVYEDDTITMESEAQAGDKTSLKHKTLPSWVHESMWHVCQYLEAMVPGYNNICRSIRSCKEQWELFRDSDDPYTLMKSPVILKGSFFFFVTSIWDLKLSEFQRLILIRYLSFETLPAAINKFIKTQLGPEYLATGSFDLKEIFKESTAKTPLIFILSPGCDPAAQMIRFAKELRGSTVHLDMISLGRGQGPKAEELISKAQILKGRWVFLQNCHLAASWMPKLQSIVESFNKPSDEMDPQFRLWLSSKPDPSFPVSILQTGIKMTVEPPTGIKNNMLRTFGSGGAGVITENLYEGGASSPAWRKLLFGLCIFNSIIQERKKYGTLGWNISYEFNDSDLEVSVLKLQMLLEEQSEIPWAALMYLTGEVTYGGRVTDDWDRRCLLSLLSKFYTPDVLKSDHCYSVDQVSLTYFKILKSYQKLQWILPIYSGRLFNQLLITGKL
ncbi:hypothetical protein LOTGIDRAFT_133247 [Lottia gigantea]|uniref:AAA+ ATPase domain-containing protein n=1 Tax=Lottia gigantea TaxID=225164 RepID=V3ZH70_LOTGI|nr:hypothetical protein LOTGIDRAFT_133247 [Lottia gigantea]ESO83512.1 hypothetical protein LOTGIDRAFT_133247 [Lottia gigantea]